MFKLLITTTVFCEAHVAVSTVIVNFDTKQEADEAAIKAQYFGHHACEYAVHKLY